MVLRRCERALTYCAQLLGRFAQEPAVRGDRLVLHLERFGVLQWHVEEHPLEGVQCAVRGGLHTRERQAQSLLVAGEGACLAPEDLPRKLIEQNDQAQPPPRAVRPTGQRTAHRSGRQLRELSIDEGILPNPQLRVRAPSEPQLHASIELGAACRAAHRPGSRLRFDQRAKPELPHPQGLVHRYSDFASSGSFSFSSCCAASTVAALNFVSSSLTAYWAASTPSSWRRNRRTAVRADSAVSPSACRTCSDISRLDAYVSRMMFFTPASISANACWRLRARA